MERVEKSALTIERRARRRWWWWIVVALVLCLGAYLGWRTQNFGDPRYVGRWNIVQVHSGRLRTELEFFADGTGAMYEVVDSQPEAVMDFRWGVENELLQIDNDPTRAPTLAPGQLHHDHVPRKIVEFLAQLFALVPRLGGEARLKDRQRRHVLRRSAASE